MVWAWKYTAISLNESYPCSFFFFPVLYNIALQIHTICCLVLKVTETIYCAFFDSMQAKLFFLRIKMIVELKMLNINILIRHQCIG